jgi:hypothetical protein
MPSATSKTEFVAADSLSRREQKNAITTMAEINFEIHKAG